MQHNTLKRIHKWKKPAPVGRGSKRGKTSGRGTKGQNARAGRKLRPEIRDVIMRLPKLRGRGSNQFVSRFAKPIELKLGLVSRAFSAGETVTFESLIKSKIVRSVSKSQGVKILGGGIIDKPINFVGVTVTASVKAAIEKAGGTVK
jgi:large subunit ribosomal protein L15